MTNRARRAGLAVTVMIVPAVLMAACSAAGGPPHGAGTPSSPSAVAYTACMRAHGIPDFPDPNTGNSVGGGVPKVTAQQLGVGTSRLRAAEHACQGLLPNTGASYEQQVRQCAQVGVCPPALVQQMLSRMRSFAGCMRAHGLPNWPDPTLTSAGVPAFAISLSRDGFDPHSAQSHVHEQQCQRLTGGAGPYDVTR